MGKSSTLEPFHALEILARAKELEKAGRSVLHLEVGEPAAPPAPLVLEAVRRALPEGQPYTAAKGQPALREALAAFYAARHHVTIDPEAVVVTMGSSAAFILAFLGGFGPGARIAVTQPGYPAYLNTLAGLNLTPIEIPLTAGATVERMGALGRVATVAARMIWGDRH